MTKFTFSRRGLLGGAPAAAAAALFGRRATAATPAASDAFQYEVVRSEAEWREMLSDAEYTVMRENGTEAPHSHPHWDSVEPGTYHCKGCGLEAYDARWKVVLDKGWLFFRHSQPDAALTAIDRKVYDQFASRAENTTTPIAPDDFDIGEVTPEEQTFLDELLGMEVHCRRCASHFGHILWVDRKLLHCVNGSSFDFTAETA